MRIIKKSIYRAIYLFLLEAKFIISAVRQEGGKFREEGGLHTFQTVLEILRHNFFATHLTIHLGCYL